MREFEVVFSIEISMENMKMLKFNRNNAKMVRITLINHFLVGISYKVQGFPWNFAFSMEIPSKMASLNSRIFYR